MNAIDVKINQESVDALRHDDGPLQKLNALKDEIANFNQIFSRKKAKAEKIIAAGKQKQFLHIDKVKLVQVNIYMNECMYILYILYICLCKYIYIHIHIL